MGLSAKNKNHDIELLNTAFRGQVILVSDESGDIESINGMVQLGMYLGTFPLDGKKQTMLGAISNINVPHTFGISYTGKVDWGGMEKYISNVYPFAGEMALLSVISVEVFTIGDFFSICIMQPGKNPKFINELIKAFADNGINCELADEGSYVMPDFKMP